MYFLKHYNHCLLITMIIMITLSLFALVTSDDFSKAVQEEEQERYQEYLKAITSGNIFQSLTNQEIADAEEAMAAIYPLGDPDLPFPETEEDLDADLCGVYAERDKKIMSYVRRRYPSQLMLQVTIRLDLHSVAKKNAEYCQNAKSRKEFTEMAKEINKAVEKLKLPRNTLIGSFRAVIYDQPTKSKLGIICCSYWKFKKDAVKALPNKRVKKFVKDMLTAYNSKCAEYLCVNYAEDSKSCAAFDIPLPPDDLDDKRFASISSSAIEALSKVNSFER